MTKSTLPFSVPLKQLQGRAPQPRHLLTSNLTLQPLACLQCSESANSKWLTQTIIRSRQARSMCLAQSSTLRNTNSAPLSTSLRLTIRASRLFRPHLAPNSAAISILYSGGARQKIFRYLPTLLPTPGLFLWICFLLVL